MRSAFLSVGYMLHMFDSCGFMWDKLLCGTKDQRHSHQNAAYILFDFEKNTALSRACRASALD